METFNPGSLKPTAWERARAVCCRSRRRPPAACRKMQLIFSRRGYRKGTSYCSEGQTVVSQSTCQAIAKALGSFNGDPEVRVMLMPAKTAAAGLTLTAASRVILLEPAADPAVPQQAVARVHRVGQTRPVTVYQLLVSDTVEEPLWRMQQDRQHLFGGEQGAEDDEEGAAERADALPAPLANPQALRPEDLQRLLESIMDLDDVAGGGAAPMEVY